MSKAHTVRIERDNSLRDVSISVSSGLSSSLGLSSGLPLTIAFGLRSTSARITTHRSGDKSIRVSQALISSLKLPTGIKLHTQYKQDILRLGPVLGIFAPTVGPGRFGAHTPYIKSLIRLSRRMGIWAYVFSSSGIDFDTKLTYGYTISSGHWRRGRFPLPDVCYDRIPSRRIEAFPRVKAVKETLRNTPGLICFNDRFMDKWKVHRQLEGNTIADQYLPRTKKYESIEDLKQFLTKYKRVYLKPCGGSQGQGIIKVIREGNERFYYVAAGKGHGLIKGYETLAKRLTPLTSNRRYIIQQGLSLATVAGRHYDIRLLLQKDSTGRWLVTKGYARIAAPGRITSNISTGAEGIGMSRALRRTFGKRARIIAGRVRSAGLKIAPVVERELGQTLGELGLDMGVDRAGRVWLIEVNSKPFRHMTTETGSKLEILKSVIRPLSYTLGISGFHKMKVSQPSRHETVPDNMDEGRSESEAVV